MATGQNYVLCVADILDCAREMTMKSDAMVPPKKGPNQTPYMLKPPNNANTNTYFEMEPKYYSKPLTPNKIA